MYKMSPFKKQLYGYQKGVGTQDAIATVIHELTKTPKAPTFSIFLDIEKAFELVNKHVILEALIKKGITGKVLSIINDFLTNRKARVVFQGAKSQLIKHIKK